MEFSRFSLGLRFAMTSAADLTAEQAWDILFQNVPPVLIGGLTLFGMWDTEAADEPEPAYVCLFSNASLKRAKRLFADLENNAYLCSFLTAYRPFVQNNRVEKCGKVACLGTIQPDGAVCGGDVSFGAMRFSGSLHARPPRMRILVATEALCPEYTPADSGRLLMRAAAAAFPKAHVDARFIACGGAGTLDTLMAAASGRYQTFLFEGKRIRYGILPDGAAVVECGGLSDEALSAVAAQIDKSGYHKLLLAAGGAPVNASMLPEGMEVTVLTDRTIADGELASGVCYRSGIDKVLEDTGFFRVLDGAALLITGSRAVDEQLSVLGTTVDALLFHCRKRGIRSAVLAYDELGRFYGKALNQPMKRLAASEMEAAADELMEQVKNELHREDE